MKLILTCALCLSILTGCQFWHKTVKPIVSAVDDVARSMCSIFFGEQHGIDPAQAAKTYCDTREKFAPWIDPALAATRQGALIATGEEPQGSLACNCECE